MARCEICDRPLGPPDTDRVERARRFERCYGDGDEQCATLRVDWRNRCLIEKWRRETAERLLTEKTQQLQEAHAMLRRGR